jgi:hypothetical protein
MKYSPFCRPHPLERDFSRPSRQRRFDRHIPISTATFRHLALEPECFDDFNHELLEQSCRNDIRACAIGRGISVWYVDVVTRLYACEVCGATLILYRPKDAL